MLGSRDVPPCRRALLALRSGDILMLVAGVRAHQAHLVLWQALAAMEAATVIGSSALCGISGHLGRPLAYRYGRLLRLNPERLGRAEARIRSGGWRAIVLLRLVLGLRIATVEGCGPFEAPFRVFLPSVALGGFRIPSGVYTPGLLCRQEILAVFFHPGAD